MKTKDSGIKKLMGFLRPHSWEHVKEAGFRNHQRGLHCNQGWPFVHTKSCEIPHKLKLLKPIKGLRKWAEWLSTVCVLCRLGSDTGAVCYACRQAMQVDWDSVPRCWCCKQRLASPSSVPPLPTTVPFLLCRDCRRLPRGWQRTVAVVDYEQPWIYWIHGLKIQLRWQWAKPMGQLLGQAWNRLEPPRPVGPTLWVPIPARSDALRLRGFNQACELARFAVPEVDSAKLVHALRWQKAAAQTSQAQKWRTRQQRRYDRQRAFQATAQVRGAQVVLVDDVMTTGFTLQAAALACLQAGAHSVWVAVFARVPYE